MISPPKKQLTMLFTCLVIFSLCWTSCEDASQTSADEKASQVQTKATPKLNALPDSLNEGDRATYQGFFSAVNETGLTNAFFFDGAEQLEKKVVSLQLDSLQIEGFYQRLKAAQGDSTSTLQIDMALVHSGNAPMPIQGQANFTTMLTLMSNDPNTTEISYPLDAFSSNFTADFEQLYGWQDDSDCPVIEDCTNSQLPVGISISAKCTKELVDNWEATPVNQVIEQLYVNKDTSSAANRIQYYTFDAVDTENIYQHLDTLKSESKPLYFYLHLGQLVGQDCVPLRMIIHLDDNPIDAQNIPERAKDGAAYFEFAKPCPKLCSQ